MKKTNSKAEMTTADTEEAGTERYMVPGLERGLSILCEFSRENRALSAPELARRFNLPRSTVFRLLTTLENMGFIEKMEGGRDYRLGLAVLRLGFEYLASLELNELGLPLLGRLSDAIGYPCNIVVRDGRSIVYVAKVSSPTPFTSSVAVGTRLPAHATVLGHILLGDLTLMQLRKLYPEEKLESFSERTPRTVNELFDMVQLVHQSGYVVSQGFFESNISTVAAPVRDHTGHVVAALGATIGAGHLDEGQLGELVERVQATADELSGLLNYSPAATGGNVLPLHA
ncbi:MAG: IclR family transcriptional regulator [Rhodoferax sp.]